MNIIKENGSKLKAVVFEMISSAPASLFPIKEMNSLVRKYAKDAKILIDGAHVVG